MGLTVSVRFLPGRHWVDCFCLSNFFFILTLKETEVLSRIFKVAGVNPGLYEFQIQAGLWVRSYREGLK